MSAWLRLCLQRLPLQRGLLPLSSVPATGLAKVFRSAHICPLVGWGLETLVDFFFFPLLCSKILPSYFKFTSKEWACKNSWLPPPTPMKAEPQALTYACFLSLPRILLWVPRYAPPHFQTAPHQSFLIATSEGVLQSWLRIPRASPVTAVVTDRWRQTGRQHTSRRLVNPGSEIPWQLLQRRPSMYRLARSLRQNPATPELLEGTYGRFAMVWQ